MRVMLVGDVIGRPGRRAFREYVQKLRREKKIDVVIVNGENSAAGKGLTRTSLDELYSGGADIITTGNHVWDKKDVMEFIDSEPFLIRPANYPEGTPGKGYCLYPFKAKTIGVMNLSGRTFMPALDCPFQKAEELLKEMQGQCDLLFLDFHAETTSEKMALGFYLDGKITGLVGTHTHIQTSDERPARALRGGRGRPPGLLRCHRGDGRQDQQGCGHRTYSHHGMNLFEGFFQSMTNSNGSNK